MIIDPWGSELPEDYSKIVKDFGLDVFDSKLFPEPNRLMRRGVIFAGRDLKRIADCIKQGKKYYALSGIMPTADRIHFGTKMVVEQLRYFQDHGAHTYILVADLEAQASRGVSLEEGKRRALEFHIPAYIALGLNPKKTSFYFQSENMHVMQIAFDAANHLTANEFKAAYGSNEPGRILSVVTQFGDMLYPQLAERMPGIIPVGIDQEPHVRLCRDYIGKVSSKKYVPISSIYHKYTRALNGDLKMSKSKPESMLELPEDLSSVEKKIKRALTGGRDTIEEHRKLGGDVKNDMVFELLKQHLVENDSELKEIHDKYVSGEMLSGELKKIAIDKMNEFMTDFEEKLASARSQIKNLHFVGK
ncbi:tryptophan--tRNA ligase [Candidatus Micrarchaeota archaeon]|nr:tryptophan--tRNA ligase [Candidatus Micrarchaeota archaeon]